MNITSISSFFSRLFTEFKTKILIQFIFVIFLAAVLYSFLPIIVISYAYSVSIFLRSVLMFVLPFLIIGAISTSLSRILKGGVKLLLFIILLSIFLDFFNGTIGYFVGKRVTQSGVIFPLNSFNRTVDSAFQLVVPQLINIKLALVAGVIVGILTSLFKLPRVEFIMIKINFYSTFFFSKIFIKFLPIAIFGFSLKILYEGKFMNIIKNGFFDVTLILIILFGYFLITLIIASNFKLLRCREILINIMPSMLAAAGTSSIFAATPLSMAASEKNIKDSVVARKIISIKMNINYTGSLIAITLLIFIVIEYFHVQKPNYSTFIIFISYFMMNKFAGIGIPFGIILITLPVLQSVFNFSNEMSDLIIALYVILDPIINLINVGINNLLMIIINPIYNKLHIKKTP